LNQIRKRKRCIKEGIYYSLSYASLKVEKSFIKLLLKNSKHLELLKVVPIILSRVMLL
jgi:hypothetical protein